MAKCPNCSKQILWNAKDCQWCQASFLGEAAWRPIPDTFEEEQWLKEQFEQEQVKIREERAAAITGPTPPLSAATVLAPVVFIGYGFASVLLMTWWGFGGYNSVVTSFFRSVPVQIAVYLSIEFGSIYILLYRAGRTLRKAAFHGFFAPWWLLLLIALPQGAHAGAEVLLLVLVSLLMWLTRLPGEMFCSWLSPSEFYGTRT